MDRISIETVDGLTLEGEVRLPDGPARGSAVLCHPHPLQGGSKDHPILWALRNDLSARGLAVVSFNFRGVMGSEGEHGAGSDELLDVRAAVGFARQAAPGATFVAGWSFGAHIALREAMEDERVAGLALIGFPLDDRSLELPALPGRGRLRAYARPVLLVAGEADLFCPLPELRALGRRLGNATVEVLPGTDHFFWKRERELAKLIGDFVDRALLTT